MKKIKIFLASSIVEFKHERQEIENFIRKISDDFEEKYEIKILPVMCENIDDAYTLGRKQEEYNEIIRGCEFCYFIFFTKAGQYTVEEFEVARLQFEQTKKPKIYTYFKVLGDETPDRSLLDFMETLDKTFGHYYGSFDHIDTIKLRILMSLKLEEMGFLEIKSEKGICKVDGKDVLDLSDVAEFKNNKDLSAFYDAIKETEEKYQEMKPIFEKGNCDEEFLKKYAEVATKRANLQREAEELETRIFNMSLKICEGQEVTARQKEAYRLFELGDYEGCISVLNADEIDADFLRARKKIREQETALCRKYIKEHETAIDILNVMPGYKSRFEEIDSRYKKIVPCAMEMGIELDIITSYCDFLIAQRRAAEVIPIAAEAEKLFDAADDWKKKVSFYNAYAMAFDAENEQEKAKCIYEKSLKLCVEAEENDTREDKEFIAATYANAAGFLETCDETESAGDYYNKAVSIYEKLAELDSEKYESKLAAALNGVAIFQTNQAEYLNAMKTYERANEIYGRLMKKEPERVIAEYAVMIANFGSLYHNLPNPEKGEPHLKNAIEIYKLLVMENSERFEFDLAMAYGNYACLLEHMEKPGRAGKQYAKAEEIIERLVSDGVSEAMGGLSGIYHNMAGYFVGKDEPEEAKKYFEKSIAMREELAKKAPDKFGGELCQGYSDYSYFLSQNGDLADADDSFERAITLAEKLAQKDPKKYSLYLARIYCGLVGHVSRNNEASRLVDMGYKCVTESVDILEALSEKYPDIYREDLATCYNNAGLYYGIFANPKNAEKYHKKAIEEWEKLSDKQPKYREDLAKSCSNLAAFNSRRGNKKDAAKYNTKAVNIQKELARENPAKYEPGLAGILFNYAKASNDADALYTAVMIAEKYPQNIYCREILNRINNLK